MLAGLAATTGKSSIADALNKINSVLNEAVNTLKLNLGKISNKNEINWKLNTKYKAEDIEDKSGPGLIKFKDKSKSDDIKDQLDVLTELK